MKLEFEFPGVAVVTLSHANLLAGLDKLEMDGSGTIVSVDRRLMLRFETDDEHYDQADNG